MPKDIHGCSVTVVGLCGKARSGKDTAANFLASELGGNTTILPMAGPLKQMLNDLLQLAAPVGGKWNAPALDAHERLHGALKEEAHPLLGKSARQMMQTLGTDWGRQMVCADIWIKLMQNRIEARAYDVANDVYAKGKQELVIVIPDIRYDNEAVLLCDYIIEVVRDGAQAVAQHKSEGGISRELITLVLHNSEGMEELSRKVLAAAAYLQLMAPVTRAYGEAV